MVSVRYILHISKNTVFYRLLDVGLFYFIVFAFIVCGRLQSLEWFFFLSQNASEVKKKKKKSIFPPCGDLFILSAAPHLLDTSGDL